MMSLFETVKDACREHFGEGQVQEIEENQLEIAVLNDAQEAMFPVYLGFHSEHDVEMTAILFQVPDVDADAFIAQCNQLNTQYPWVKFALDSGYLCAGMDLMLYTGDVEDIMSMLAALLQVICSNLLALLG